MRDYEAILAAALTLLQQEISEQFCRGAIAEAPGEESSR
jgi:hypothetical protein